MNKVGCIFTVRFRYYDVRENKTKTKKRPFLIIKEENSTYPIDLTALPVSSVTNKNRLNLYYDIEINKNTYPSLNLNKEISYIRTNKVQTINEKDLISKVCDNFKDIYPALYEEIEDKVKKYFDDIFSYKKRRTFILSSSFC